MFDPSGDLSPLLNQAGDNVREGFRQVAHAQELGESGTNFSGTLLPNTGNSRQFILEQNAVMGERRFAWSKL
jgi:hypothetical protein